MPRLDLRRTRGACEGATRPHLHSLKKRNAKRHSQHPDVENGIRQPRALGESAHGLGVVRRPAVQLERRIQQQGGGDRALREERMAMVHLVAREAEEGARQELRRQLLVGQANKSLHQVNELSQDGLCVV